VPAAKLIPPEDDVQRFYKERIETQDGSSLTATSLYEDYCEWCEENKKEPLALPTFGRDFGELGVQKAKIAGRVRYIGIALKSGQGAEEDKKLTTAQVEAA
jgi:phage/plasmid-associated DNA primase